MITFSITALTKLNDLIKREDFIRTFGIMANDHHIVVNLEFESKDCAINNFGVVTWITEHKATKQDNSNES
jgi:hypothetical protein